MSAVRLTPNKIAVWLVLRRKAPKHRPLAFNHCSCHLQPPLLMREPLSSTLLLNAFDSRWPWLSFTEVLLF